MKVGDKVTDHTGSWIIAKIWDDGDVTLISSDGYRIDVSSECFEHHYKPEKKE